MGAATSLLHGERDPSIAGMVLDSSFADLTMLAEEMVEKGRQHGLFAPNFIVKIAIRFIRSTILKTADFDIKTLSPIEHADKCYIPALFVAAEGDAFVPPHHRSVFIDPQSHTFSFNIIDFNRYPYFVPTLDCDLSCIRFFLLYRPLSQYFKVKKSITNTLATKT